MFVNNEITDRGLLHKLLRKATSEVTMDEREVWARSVDGALKDATSPSTMVRSRLTRPAVVLAAAPTLSAVAAVLRDDRVAVSREAIDAVRAVHHRRHRLPALRPRSPGRPPRRRRAAQPAPRGRDGPARP